jgi:hypothetical protein
MLLGLIAFFAACPLIGASLALLDRAYGGELTERWRGRVLAKVRTLRIPR